MRIRMALTWRRSPCAVDVFRPFPVERNTHRSGTVKKWARKLGDVITLERHIIDNGHAKDVISRGLAIHRNVGCPLRRGRKTIDVDAQIGVADLRGGNVHDDGLIRGGGQWFAGDIIKTIIPCRRRDIERSRTFRNRVCKYEFQFGHNSRKCHGTTGRPIQKS